MSERKPVVICGPSGVGKGTLILALQERLPATLLGVTVSDTTRSPRDGEIDGKHYNFITKEEFKAKLKRDMYIEHKEYSGNLYGTSYQAVDDVHVKSLICLMEIHITSAQYIKYKTDLTCNYVFVSTSNGLTTLEERLRSRGSESKEKVQSRLAAAAEEFEFVEKNAAFFDAIIYNDGPVEHTLENLMTQLKVWYPDLIRSPRSSGSVGSSGHSAATTPQRGVSLIGKPVLFHSTEGKKCKTTRRKDQRHTRTMNVYKIKTKTETDAAVQRMRHETCVDFDCEGIGGLSCFQCFDKISLIQISAEQTIHFFDFSKMCFRIPRSLRLIWLTSAECMKCIHDSRQDQDCIRNVRDYLVNFLVEERDISPSIPAQELRQRSRRNKSRMELLPVNIFDSKQNTKVLMKRDRNLWARRPLSENLVVYAAADGYMSRLFGQYSRCKFEEWMMAKTLLVSLKWCTLVARHTDGKSSSKMSTTDLPAIDAQIAAAAAHVTRGRPFRQAGAGETKVKTKTTGAGASVRCKPPQT
mmetsp:Transcript_32998/g.53564  ORF Transcript_32998/g.53564 Transcript_32998/m.53564 type:complete len:525 (-) Transcript_32998:1147-2721(-)